MRAPPIAGCRLGLLLLAVAAAASTAAAARPEPAAPRRGRALVAAMKPQGAAAAAAHSGAARAQASTASTLFNAEGKPLTPHSAQTNGHASAGGLPTAVHTPETHKATAAAHNATAAPAHNATAAAAPNATAAAPDAAAAAKAADAATAPPPPPAGGNVEYVALTDDGIEVFNGAPKATGGDMPPAPKIPDPPPPASDGARG